jgi:hypothetical protein
MRQSVQHYRKPGNEPFQPGRSNNQPQVRRPLNEDTEQRIVTLYTSGQSIESITKEVGRARYLVVHVLQSRGVFGNRPTEPDCEEPGTGPVAVEDMTEELVVKEQAPESVAVSGPESEIAAKEPPRKVKRVRKLKPPEQLQSSPAEKPTPEPATPENSSTAGRWSPLLVDALYQLVAQQDIDTGITLEEVKKMVSKH